MAEGNYPFASTYITFSVGPGMFPLPPWPMRVACARGLNMDFGVKFSGNRSAVDYTVSLGGLHVAVDWNESKTLATDASVNARDPSGLFGLVRGVSEAVGVWYNVSGHLKCFDASASSLDAAAPAPAPAAAPAPAPPGKRVAVCGKSFGRHSKTESWSGVTCNENLHLVNTNVKGIGRDFFWPPNVHRDWSFSQMVEEGGSGGCRAGPSDPSG